MCSQAGFFGEHSSKLPVIRVMQSPEVVTRLILPARPPQTPCHCCQPQYTNIPNAESLSLLYSLALYNFITCDIFPFIYIFCF